MRTGKNSDTLVGDGYYHPRDTPAGVTPNWKLQRTVSESAKDASLIFDRAAAPMENSYSIAKFASNSEFPTGDSRGY